MTQAISAPAPRFGEWRIVAPICAAHFVSHYYMIVLAPLFAFIKADYGVSYTDLGLALTAFNVVSAALQTPAGFLVDHIGARIVLIAGVALSAAAFAVAGVVHSYAIFVAMFAIAGLGNTAYHPANYSLLSQYTPGNRIGQIYSVHTFAGIAGSFQRKMTEPRRVVTLFEAPGLADVGEVRPGHQGVDPDRRPERLCQSFGHRVQPSLGRGIGNDAAVRAQRPGGADVDD